MGHYVASKVLPIGSVILDLAQEALKMPDMKRDDSKEGLSINIDNSIKENYRNTQPLNHRKVFYFNHENCEKKTPLETQSTPRSSAHYEKIKKDVFYHIFVPGEHPSGIPGSFVESKEDSLGKK